MAALAEFVLERVPSGIAAAKARGKQFGRRLAAAFRWQDLAGSFGLRKTLELPLDRSTARAQQEYGRKHRSSAHDRTKPE
jgi:hypothetical protein